MQHAESITDSSPRIKMYRQRSISECVSASFDFIRENWKTLFKFASYLLVPLALVQGAYYNETLESRTIDPFSHFFFNMGSVFLFHLVGYVLATAIVYTLLATYEEREQRLVGIEFSDIKPLFTKNIWRTLAMALVGGVAGVAAIALTGAIMNLLHPIIVVPAFFAGVAILIPASMILPVYLFEDCRMGEAISKGFRLGFSSWGYIFGFTILMAIIVSVVSGIVEAPLTILIILKALLMENDDLSNYHSLLSVGGLLAAVISSYVTLLTYTVLPIGTAYMYGNISEKEDGLSNARDIDNFEEMSQKHFDDIEDFDKTGELI